MKIVDPGRSYELAGGNRLAFVQKEDGTILRDGTTIEEVLQVLIDRVTEAYRRLPCEESIRGLHLLREALATFQLRTARRVEANVEGTAYPRGHFPESTDVSISRTASTEGDEIDYGPN
jgi:hypothetical protein